MSFRQTLRSRAAQSGCRLVFPEGDDPRVIAAARILTQLDICTPILLTADACREHRLIDSVADHLRMMRPDRVTGVNEAQELCRDPLRLAAGMVALGEADGCVAGAVYPTADVLRAALWLIGLAPRQSALSAATYLALGSRVLTFTDTAVIPEPSAEQLVGMAIAAAADRVALVGDTPIVALLSYSTWGSAGGVNVERVRRAAAMLRAAMPELVSDGELQLDAALVPEVAARKCPSSPVAGQANVLVFPSLDSANIGYKLVERIAGATAAGPLLQGLARPMSDLSRGAGPDDIVDVAAMVALQARSHALRERR